MPTSNVVIYARYSSDNQREESIEGQLRECRAYAERNDMKIIGSYIDRALSAKTDARPQFQKMIQDSNAHRFQFVLVWKLDRFSRNHFDSAYYKRALSKNNVKVISATEPISNTPEGIMLESMLEGMAEYYSAELSEKVIRGHTENALKCKYNGGTPTFGFIIDKEKCYQIDPHTAPVVLESFTRYANGATMKEVMQYLVESGFTTVRGRKIDLNFIARLLKNRKYIGIQLPPYRPPRRYSRYRPARPVRQGAAAARNKQESPSLSQGRGRLSFDYETLLRHLRGYDGGRERHQRQQRPEVPLLPLCEHQEAQDLRRQTQERPQAASGKCRGKRNHGESDE